MQESYRIHLFCNGKQNGKGSQLAVGTAQDTGVDGRLGSRRKSGSTPNQMRCSPDWMFHLTFETSYSDCRSCHEYCGTCRNELERGLTEQQTKILLALLHILQHAFDDSSSQITTTLQLFRLFQASTTNLHLPLSMSFLVLSASILSFFVRVAIRIGASHAPTALMPHTKKSSTLLSVHRCQLATAQFGNLSLAPSVGFYVFPQAIKLHARDRLSVTESIHTEPKPTASFPFYAFYIGLKSIGRFKLSQGIRSYAITNPSWSSSRISFPSFLSTTLSLNSRPTTIRFPFCPNNSISTPTFQLCHPNGTFFPLSNPPLCSYNEAIRKSSLNISTATKMIILPTTSYNPKPN